MPASPSPFGDGDVAAFAVYAQKHQAPLVSKLTSEPDAFVRAWLIANAQKTRNAEPVF